MAKLLKLFVIKEHKDIGKNGIKIEPLLVGHLFGNRLFRSWTDMRIDDYV